jgi:glycosyltransferase involved in cell wall biosynthesis
MLFSIIIPVYNVEKYLKDCLDSILLQNFNDFEIICVDDGSTDSSRNICDQYFEKYPEKIKVLHQKNQGGISARVTGLREAQGEYYLIFDADDMIERKALSLLAAEIDRNPVDLILFRSRRITEDGVITNTQRKQYVDLLPAIEGNIDNVKRLIVTSEQINSLSTKCFHNSLFDKFIDYSNFFKVRKAEDLLMSLSIVDRLESVSVLDECLYLYRMNPAGGTYRQIGVQFIESLLTVYQEVCKYAKKWDIPEEIFTQRFSFTVRGVFSRLVVYRFNNPRHTKEERHALIKRMLAQDFQSELKKYSPKRKLSIDNLFYKILSLQSVYFIDFCILTMAIGWKLTKNLHLKITPGHLQ